MATRQTVREELRRRLGDVAIVVWSDAELNGFIDNGISGLYPTYYRRVQATTTAGAGPIQTFPVATPAVRNVYKIAIQYPSSTRVHSMMGWTEGDTGAFLPVGGITGATLVWSWTKGFTVPTLDATVLDVTPEAEEVLILRTQITAMENLLSDRVKTDKFFALNIRQGVTEQDIAIILDALHSSLNKRQERAIPLPEVMQ